MTEKDLTVEGQRVTANLPAPMILFTRLDNSKTRVYDRSTGILTKGDSCLKALKFLNFLDYYGTAGIYVKALVFHEGVIDNVGKR
jgi:hypothetical protein